MYEIEFDELKRMMHDAKLRHFEKVVVWSVDRLGRSMRNLVLVLKGLNRSDIANAIRISGIPHG